MCAKSLRVAHHGQRNRNRETSLCEPNRKLLVLAQPHLTDPLWARSIDGAFSLASPQRSPSVRIGSGAPRPTPADNRPHGQAPSTPRRVTSKPQKRARTQPHQGTNTRHACPFISKAQHPKQDAQPGACESYNRGGKPHPEPRARPCQPCTA
eukprot:scaffold260197_cov31-Tisochrysis_lutea.AAC.3